jgi:hypothetical protein
VLSLPVDQLSAGQVVVSDICAHNGLVIVAAGHALAEATLERIRNFAELGEVNEPVLVQAASNDDLVAVPMVPA